MIIIVAILILYHVICMCVDLRSKVPYGDEYELFSYVGRSISSHCVAFPLYVYSCVDMETRRTAFILSVALFTVICICTVVSAAYRHVYTDFLNTLFFGTAIFAALHYNRFSRAVVLVVPALLVASVGFLLFETFRKKRQYHDNTTDRHDISKTKCSCTNRKRQV